jgi:tyrosine-protein kinase Etk/Wzc
MQDKAQDNSLAKSELWSLSFRDLFYKYVRFLPLFVLSVAIALLGAFMYLRYKVPAYSSSGSLIIKTDNKPTAGNQFQQILSDGNALNIQSEMEILKSRPLMERVVKKLDLEWTYKAAGKIKTVNIYTKGPFWVRTISLNDSNSFFTFDVKAINSNEFKLNKEVNLYKYNQPIKTPFGVFVFEKVYDGPIGGTYKVEREPSWSAAGKYASLVQVQPKAAGTGILNISMRVPNPELGADIINMLMSEYSVYTVEQKKLSSDQQLAFIDERLGDIGAKLDSLKQVAINFQNQNNVVDIQSQSESIRQIMTESDKQINEEIAKKYIIDLLDNYVNDKKNEYTKVPSSLALEDMVLAQMIAQYNLAQSERKRLLDANVPPAHPIIKEMEGQIEKNRNNIRESLRNIKAVSEPIISRAQTRSNSSSSQLQGIPSKQMELQERLKAVTTVESLFKLFSDQREITAIQRSSITTNSEIVSKAGASWDPVSPKRRSIQIMAILAGLLIPATFIFLSEVLNDKVATRFDIEKITAAPIIGEIGHSYGTETLVVTKASRSMVAEQFRIIRSNLQYIITGKEKATILVTSSFSGEGKSYISTNMGAVFSLAAKKTVILELDIRKPRVLSGLGMSKGPGISNYLVGKSDNLNELLRPVPNYDNLYVLGCGPIPPNPSELLLTERVEKMFTWLQANFDMVIIDTAPVGMVGDAMTLGKFAEASLYIVRQGHTFKKQIALIDEFYQEKKLPKVSIILNDVKLKPGYGYYGYGRYGYGYGYGYGSYYEEETAPSNFFERVLEKLDFRKFFKMKKRK